MCIIYLFPPYFVPIHRQDQQHDAEVLHGAEGQDAQQTDS